MNSRIFSLFILLGLVSSCAGLLDQRSFISEMDRVSDGLFVAGRDFPVVPGDSGQVYRSQEEIYQRTPASFRSKDEYLEQQSLMGELRRREANLTEWERKEYRQALEYLPTESEKIYYLTLSPAARRDYIDARSYQRPSTQARAVSSLMDDLAFNRSVYTVGDISLGMSKHDVTGVWGQPARVEVAGNPRHENERWVFVEGRKVRYVYFEGGRVNGWVLE